MNKNKKNDLVVNIAKLKQKVNLRKILECFVLISEANTSPLYNCVINLWEKNFCKTISILWELYSGLNINIFSLFYSLILFKKIFLSFIEVCLV